MPKYSEVAWERAMRVQEVILRAMAKRITWGQAAEIIGISDRSMRRWRQRYEEHGYDGLFDRRGGKPSPKRVPLARAEEVLRLYQDKYPDLNVRHFHEKLREAHQIELSYTGVKLALQGAGLVKKGRKRGVHRKRRALKELGIEMIPAYSPQARGRSERRFGTWQGRLPQELRLAGISGVEEANRFLRDRYIPEMNRKFGVAAAEKGHAFVPVRGSDLDRIFSVQTERVVAKDNTVRLDNCVRQIERTPWRGTLAGCRVTLCEHLDGRVSIVYGPHVVGRYTVAGEVLPTTGKPRAPRCGNDAPWKAWKSQKADFPTLSTALGNPAKSNGAGFPHSHSAGGG